MPYKTYKEKMLYEAIIWDKYVDESEAIFNLLNNKIIGGIKLIKGSCGDFDFPLKTIHEIHISFQDGTQIIIYNMQKEFGEHNSLVADMNLEEFKP